MPRDTSFKEHIVHDILGDVPGISSKPMFSGCAIYKDGTVFGIIVESELYFKVDDSNRSEYEKIASHPFTYSKNNGKAITLSYWLVPEEIFEDKEKLLELMDKSIEISSKKSPSGRFPEMVWSFYKTHSRSLPWRKNPTSYHVFVSEIMLQQTQAPRVIPKFNSFVQKFPDFKTLAKAPLSKVLKEWQGLGYNRRALYLKQSAEIILSKYAGKLPEDPDLLDELPGIGHYTAGAIMAFAFNKPAVFIETNIRSVFIHHFFKKSRAKIPDNKLLPLIEKYLDHKNPREWYSALMDYGAYLKASETNPSRKSSHYVTQSTFKGSNRELRGKILKCVLQNGPTDQKKLLQIHTDSEKVTLCVTNLIKEGLLKRNKNVVEIK